MPKYTPLTDYLRRQAADSCSLRFADVERIIGCPLPASAKRHRAWWGNDRTHSQARAWMEAGFDVDCAPVHIEPVVFTRTNLRMPNTLQASAAEGPTQVIVRNLEPDVVAALKKRAARAGHSLERELRIVLARHAKPDRRELIAEADRIRAMTPGQLPDSTQLIREDRDRR